MRALFALAVLWLAATAAGQGLPPRTAMRTFLVYVGEPDLAMEVNGRSVGASDSGGSLRITLASAPGDELRFRCQDTAFVLDAVRIVPDEEPSIPILWDFSAELRPAPPPSEEAARPPPGIAEDPCHNRKSLLCRQRAWSRFEGALRRGDCAAALGGYERLVADYPDFYDSAATVATFAEAHLECGGDVRHAVELLEGFGEGELWCSPPESRLLARGFEALGDPAAAAASAARAAGRCAAGESAAREWEFYFRVRLGQTLAAAELVEGAPRRIGLFLAAWLASLGGECGVEVELEDDGELPCRGLPREFCSRQYGRILLGCGSGRDDYRTAARYLRDSLPLDPAAWAGLPPEGREVLTRLAEAEALSGRYAEAARLYEEVLRDSPSAEARALRYRRAEALMLAGEARLDRAALAAYGELRAADRGDPVAFAVVVNNICVLRARLGASLSDENLAGDLEVLEAALEAPTVAAQSPHLDLLLRHSLLTLKTDLLERDTSMDSSEKLARLRELRGAYDAYQEELRSFAAVGGGVVEVDSGRYVVALLEVEKTP